VRRRCAASVLLRNVGCAAVGCKETATLGEAMEQLTTEQAAMLTKWCGNTITLRRQLSFSTAERAGDVFPLEWQECRLNMSSL
jgi:hypothetical protein